MEKSILNCPFCLIPLPCSNDGDCWLRHYELIQKMSKRFQRRVVSQLMALNIHLGFLNWAKKAYVIEWPVVQKEHIGYEITVMKFTPFINNFG